MAASTLHQVETAGSRMGSVRRLGGVLRERAWLIFLCILLGAAAAATYLQYAPKSYAATTRVKHQDRGGEFVAFSNVPKPDRGTQMKEIRRTLVSRDLLRKVVANQRLAENDRFGGRAAPDEAAERAVDALLQCLSLSPEEDTVIDVTVTDASPDLAARVANALVDQLQADYASESAATLNDVNRRLQTMLQQVWEELAARRSAQPTEPDGQPGALLKARQELEASLRSLNARLVEQEVKHLELAGEWNQARELAGRPDPAAVLQVPFISAHPAVSAAQKSWLERQLAFEAVTQRYKEKHANYVSAAAQLADAVQALSAEVNVALKALEEAVEQARSQAKDVRSQIDVKLAELSALPSQVAPDEPARATFNEEKILRDIGEEVMQRLKEFTLGREFLLTPLQQTLRATVPTHPVGPDVTRVCVVGLLAGLLVGLLLSLVFGYGDTSLRSVDEVEQVTDLPVLCVIPRLKDNDTELAAAEGFRSLRTAIAVSSKEKEPRLIQFTSTSPDEGKTFCALNFAVGLAQQGHQTVLIECDLRRPMAAPSLTMVKVDAPGVSDFLKASAKSEAAQKQAGKAPHGADLSFAEIRKKKSVAGVEEKPVPAGGSAGGGALALGDILQRTEVANLFFIAAGKPVSSPTELLGRERFEDLLNSLLQRYDKVVLDSAPVLGVSETLLIASRMQGVCFVVRGNQTPRRAVVRAVEILRRADVPLLGAVLNGITPSKSDPYGQDYYYHRTGTRGG